MTAAILRRSFRENDVVARVGGDEFAIILPFSSTKIIKEAYDRITTELAKHNEENPLIPLSFSIGFAEGNASNGSINQIFRKADQQMYQNKKCNREKFKLLFSSQYAKFGDLLYKL